MEKKFNFVYITINLITKRGYVGEHSTNDMNCFITKNYLGSGTLLNKKVKEYGKENFKREDLEFFPTKEDAFNTQEKYIRSLNTHISENGYNKDWTGGNRLQYVNEDTKKKLTIITKGHWTGEKNPNFKGKLIMGEKNPNFRGKITRQPEIRQKLSSKMKARYVNDPELKQKVSRKGKHITPEQSRKQSERIKGKNNPRYINVDKNIIDKIIYLYTTEKLGLVELGIKFNLSHYKIKSILIEHDIKIIKNQYNRIPASNEYKEKMSKTIKNLPKLICPHCNKSVDPGNYKKYHGQNCKYK